MRYFYPMRNSSSKQRCLIGIFFIALIAPINLTLAQGAAKYPHALQNCKVGSPWVIGYNSQSGTGALIYLSCGPDGHLHQENSAPKINQKTGLPESNPQTTNSTSTATNNLSVGCSSDPQVPQEWAAVQNWDLKYRNCANPLRFLQSTLVGSPKNVSLTPSSEFLPVNDCKISNLQNAGPGSGGRYFDQPITFLDPVKGARIKVVGVNFSDVKSNSTPEQDYSKYQKFVADYVQNESDVPTNLTISYADHYLTLASTVKSYNLGTGRFNSVFLQDVADAVRKDGKINLDGVDEVVIVAPPSTPNTEFANMTGPMGQAGGIGPNGVWPGVPGIRGMYQEGSPSTAPESPGDQVWSADPWITVHEEINHHMGLNDSMPDIDASSMKSIPTNNSSSNFGTGNWGNMAGATGDLLVWHKWLVGFESDSQINCASAKKSTLSWIRPSEIKDTGTKALVIPTSSTTAIVVESQRSLGYEYKLPASMNGALVYTVDTKDTRHGFGIAVQRPSNRTGTIYQGGRWLADAALKQGEFVVVQGVKISVVASGAFGDVIKAEPESK